MELEIVHENADEILAFCCFHNDKGRANMLLNKSGPFAGQYICWSCGARGEIKDLGLEVEIKKTRRKKKRDPREMHSIWAELPYAETWITPHSPLNPYMRPYGIKFNEIEGCWVYPMLNAGSFICGLQRRFKNGRKICISGSKLGVFATSKRPVSPLVICEGLSDTLAAAELGFSAIGRPSALVSSPVVGWLSANYRSRAVIISDGNEIERKAAVELQSLLGSIVASVVLYPTHKDLSEDIAAGLGPEWRERIRG